MNEKVFKILEIAACLLGLWLGMIIGEYIVYGYEYTPEEIVMIGKIVQHECPHESELGQRLVIDTILNRVESEEFPNTVRDVLEQEGQYCKSDKLPPKDIYNVIADEIYNRTNPDVLWFRTKHYHKLGTPLIQEGSHYFSGR